MIIKYIFIKYFEKKSLFSSKKRKKPIIYFSYENFFEH